MRYFKVINIENRNAQVFIDGIRLFSSPQIKHKAHITLGGPYKNENDIEFDRIKNEYQILTVKGIGNFFSFNQNTVFLKCELKNRLKSLMNKLDFGNDNPHITLFNGHNQDFAKKLYSLLKKYKITFQIPVEKIDIIKTKSDFETFSEDFFYHLSYYLNEDISYNKIANINENERLNYIEKLLKIFTNWNVNNVIANPCYQKVISELNLSTSNGLYYFDDLLSWHDKFPYRVFQSILQIKPYAFFSLQDFNSNDGLNFNLPFLFIFSNPSDKDIKRIKRDIYNFGNAPIVIFDFKDKIELYNGLFFQGDFQNPNLKLLGNNNVLHNYTYDKLITNEFWHDFLKTKYGKNIYESFLSNITEVRKLLISDGLSSHICNRIIGRLLFIRYFIDRGVLFYHTENKEFFFPKNIEDARKEFSSMIANKNKLYNFFKYFQKKYDGDLFPITKEETNSIKSEHLSILSELFRGGQFSRQPESFSIQRSFFDIYNFSIIPIELVSNVYEKFMGEMKSENKAFYTPYILADFILEKTVGEYIKRISDINFKCIVLDPSCGSGIFLVEALRKIIERKIKINNKSLAKDQLWNCVIDNIFGIDIDPDAIDIAIFSIFITVLDYMEPKEISANFKFIKLKDTNFFPHSDFFDIDNKYNAVLSRLNIHFIIGNPPWGKIRKSPYMSYCKNRENVENSIISISDNQIAQAFLIRVSDLMNENTICAFVVTSKIFYNTNAHDWRKYFLTTFSVSEIIDFSPVRYSLFDEANWPASLIFYRLKRTSQRIILIATKPNEFFNQFNSFVINKLDIKEFDEDYFVNLVSQYDWLWKTLLYGTYFDFLIIKRLKEKYLTIRQYVKIFDMKFGVGLKRMDGNKKQNASKLKRMKFVDTKIKELSQFNINSRNLWHSDFAGNIPSLKDRNGIPIIFRAPLALIKEGLTPEYKGVAAYSNDDIVYTHSIRGIKGTKSQEYILKSFVGLINSNLFSYYIFHTGSSVGIDLTRANQIEQISFPAVISEELAKIVDKLSNKNEELFSHDQFSHESELNELVFNLFSMNTIERDFIDYTISYNIPLLKKKYRFSSITNDDLISYTKIIQDYFIRNNKYFMIQILKDDKYVGIIFQKSEFNNNKIKITTTDVIKDIIRVFRIFNYESLSKSVFLHKLLIEYDSDSSSFLILKTIDISNWQKANAWIDLVEIIKSFENNRIETYKIFEDLYNSCIDK